MRSLFWLYPESPLHYRSERHRLFSKGLTPTIPGAIGRESEKLEAGNTLFLLVWKK